MKKKTLVLWLILLLLAVLPLLAAADGIPDHRLEERLVDDADLLSDTEFSSVLTKLNSVSESLGFDVVVVTASTLGGKTPMEYADDFFDYNGYGYGQNRDGALLLISMEDRDWWVSTCGSGITIISGSAEAYVEERVLSNLKDGDYTNAFLEFADSCDYLVQLARSGKEFKEPFKAFSSGVIALVVGLIIALISVSSMKAKLKTVRYQPAANFYERSGSMNVLQQEDVFLYRHVSRVRRETESRSSSGGGSHTSSSGSSHGGFGGKF